MPTDTNSNDYAPLFWYKRNPFYLTAFICVALLIGIVVVTILDTANVDTQHLLGFWPFGFFHGRIWQLATFPFVDYPNFFSLFNILFLYWFGSDVEKYIGRRRFISLLAILWIFPPVIISAWQSPYFPEVYFGSREFTAALVIAYATLYPNLEYWGWVPMKWVAAACLFLSSLSFLPRHNWVGLVLLWAMCAAAFGYIRWLQHGAELPKVFSIFSRKPKFKVVPRETSPRDEVHESIDPILDKISKHGLASLTAREKALLERASASLQKKPQP